MVLREEESEGCGDPSPKEEKGRRGWRLQTQGTVGAELSLCSLRLKDLNSQLGPQPVFIYKSNGDRAEAKLMGECLCHVRSHKAISSTSSSQPGGLKTRSPACCQQQPASRGSVITDMQGFVLLLSLIYETLPFSSFPMVPLKRQCEAEAFRKASSNSLFHRGQTSTLTTIQIHSVMCVHSCVHSFI
ncbi:uncharacterized protein LOC116271048 isoform X2 [Papio anubis]|uniref:uncharacterized protein LOC116271048 isoform X2 n=1 Tax=Papio anubis TaxID=9555 RepID=UPI0012AE7D37|nr:uncharacterized protein LOC116271048 isoform X2 [Papio anubis]